MRASCGFVRGQQLIGFVKQHTWCLRNVAWPYSELRSDSSWKKEREGQGQVFRSEALVRADIQTFQIFGEIPMNRGTLQHTVRLSRIGPGPYPRLPGMFVNSGK